MKICHFADSHLGAGESHRRRAPGGLTERQEDLIAGFVRAVDRIIEIRPDICIHSGDLFHTVRPLNSIMARAAEQLHRLAAEHQIPTVIIAGNHDAPKQPRVGTAIDVFRQIENLHLASSGKMEGFRIGKANVVALPHCLTSATLQEQLAACQSAADAEYNILVIHGVVAGMPEFSMADLGEQEIPVEVLNRFDYAALGHFHNFCQVAPRAWYAGSTERLSQSERDADKGFAVVDLEPFQVRFESVPSRVMVDLKKIDATGKRGDEVVTELRRVLEQVDTSDKIVRVRVDNVTPEMLKTVPADSLAELREKAYALDLQFEKGKPDEATGEFGRSAIGRLDLSFVEFLETADLRGFDRERLISEAMKYLGAEE